MLLGKFSSQSAIHFFCCYHHLQCAPANAAPCSWQCLMSRRVHDPANLFQSKEPLIMQIALLIAGIGTVLSRWSKSLSDK